ncbi:HNH endonuclease [Lactococcus phage PLgY-30]|uniref:HNH endonuclease n=2 Tax=Uwajimavirus PLgW1 TaxID=2845441 RepID=A0A2Z2P8K4_9CAUD|nr:HNH endonuclease [Lactococcus phage PLgY-16]ASJ80064.1 HNH endonuclease [Lactococcus phage PLgY-30]
MRKFIRYKENYIVSDSGGIWRVNENKLEQKKLSKAKNGYLVTSINNKMEYVHRIVMTSFKGYSVLFVDHLNKDKQTRY